MGKFPSKRPAAGPKMDILPLYFFLYDIISGIAISYAAVAVVEWIDKLKNKNSEEME